MAQADPQRLMHHYKSGNTGMNLPMDYASRMARAKRMGLTIKGYHGGPHDFPHVDPSKLGQGPDALGRGLYSSLSPRSASEYAGVNGMVMPVLTTSRNLIEDYNKPNPSMTNALSAAGVPDGKNEADQFLKLKKQVGSDEATKTAVGMGYKGFDDADRFATYDPTAVRSQFARFDPRLEHLAHLSASTGGAMGKGNEFEESSQDASHIFGHGAVYKWYRHPKSGGYIQILQRPNVPASVIGLEVPEEFRGQGIGQALQAEAIRNHPSLMGQVSSKAAAKTAYRLGRRPYGNPNASLDDVFKGIDQDSSINLMTPEAQPKAKSTGGAIELARAVVAKNRAGGQIAPSKYLPNIPRAVHADGGKVARKLNEHGLYSKAFEAARNMQQAKGTPEQFMAQLKRD
jgi:GNAT superfamily N-acetyltransferase